MQGDLAVFPLPMLTVLLSTVAAGLVLRADLGRPVATRFLAAFFGVLAVGSLMVGLRFGYGVERLVPVQRGLPLFAGPLLWLGFASFTRDRMGALALAHLGAAAAIVGLAPLMFADLLDLDLIAVGSYLIYAGALVWMWSRGANHLSHARMGDAGALRRWMLASACLLVVFALADTAIALSFAMQRSGDAMALISGGAVVMGLALIAVIVAVAKGRSEGAARLVVPSGAGEGDAALEARARALLLDTRLYLDTDLTVDRLAKRLQVPSRALSLAINQIKGINVSQYVNDFRLDHAASLLSAAEGSVAEVMEQSGFLTRSNFYRAFQQRHGMTPAAYREVTKAARAGQSGI